MVLKIFFHVPTARLGDDIVAHLNYVQLFLFAILLHPLHPQLLTGPHPYQTLMSHHDVHVQPGEL